MDERELEASNRRMWVILGVGAGVLALAVALFIFLGKQLGAPIEAYDREGIARAVGEGVKQVSHTSQKEAARVTVANEQ